MILFNSCLDGRRWPNASMEYLNGGSRSIEIQIGSKRFETPTNQHLVQPRGLDKKMDSIEKWARYGYRSRVVVESTKLRIQCRSKTRRKIISSQKGRAPKSAWMMCRGTICLHLLMRRRRRICTRSTGAQSTSNKQGPQTFEPKELWAK
jgi:hypothetical protein